MSTRRTWLLGLIILLSLGWMAACGSHYKASSDGLVIVPSQGSAILQAFSFNLSNGHTAQINTSPGTNGKPAAIILDPSGAYAYIAVLPDAGAANSVTAASIAGYKINSDGTLTAAGAPVSMTPLVVGGAISPAAFAMDSSGKFLFVADQATTDSSGAAVAGSVSVFSVSNGSVTEVSGSPFAVPATLGGTNANVMALDVSKTSFPAQNAVCSGTTAPTAENLYVADAANNQVVEYAVDPSSGALGVPAGNTGSPSFPTGSVPSAVAVDPCNRFVYVANHDSNNVSGYTICNAPLLPNCQLGDGSLVSTGAPTSAGTGPKALAVDPRGNFVYVANETSNNVTGFKISPVTGALASFTTVGTGRNPVAIAIRADDSWMFVTNNQAASISQFSLIPASGTLTPATATTTDNFPWGVAVR